MSAGQWDWWAPRWAAQRVGVMVEQKVASKAVSWVAPWAFLWADPLVAWLAVLSVEMLVGLKADQTVDLLDVSMVFRLAV